MWNECSRAGILVDSMLGCICSVMTRVKQSVVDLVIFSHFSYMTLRMQKNVLNKPDICDFDEIWSAHRRHDCTQWLCRNCFAGTVSLYSDKTLTWPPKWKLTIFCALMSANCRVVSNVSSSFCESNENCKIQHVFSAVTLYTSRWHITEFLLVTSLVPKLARWAPVYGRHLCVTRKIPWSFFADCQ